MTVIYALMKSSQTTVRVVRQADPDFPYAAEVKCRPSNKFVKLNAWHDLALAVTQSAKLFGVYVNGDCRDGFTASLPNPGKKSAGLVR